MRSLAHKALLALALVTFLLPSSARADTLFFSPSAGTYSVGQTFSLRVMVSSTAQAINAVSGTVSFPNDLLQVTSISKAGSIVSLWVQEPSFSNTQGTVNFEGVIPNPGFNRQNGNVVTINFRVVGVGSPTVRFSSGSLLANDGLGTNVLRTLGTALYTLSPRVETPPAPIQEPQEAAEPVAETETPSPAANEITLTVPSASAVSYWYMRIMSIVIPIIALLFLLLYLTMHGVHRAKRTKAELRRDLHNVDQLVGKAFDLLKDDIHDSIMILERTKSRRKLTEEEDEVISRLRQNLSDAERVIHKELSKAEKHI